MPPQDRARSTPLRAAALQPCPGTFNQPSGRGCEANGWRQAMARPLGAVAVIVLRPAPTTGTEPRAHGTTARENARAGRRRPLLIRPLRSGQVRRPTAAGPSITAAAGPVGKRQKSGENAGRTEPRLHAAVPQVFPQARETVENRCVLPWGCGVFHRHASARSAAVQAIYRCYPGFPHPLLRRVCVLVLVKPFFKQQKNGEKSGSGSSGLGPRADERAIGWPAGLPPVALWPGL
jgi:hypothetical protein